MEQHHHKLATSLRLPFHLVLSRGYFNEIKSWCILTDLPKSLIKVAKYRLQNPAQLPQVNFQVMHQVHCHSN